MEEAELASTETFFSGVENGPTYAEMTSDWGDSLAGTGAQNPVALSAELGSHDVLFQVGDQWVATHDVSAATFNTLFIDSQSPAQVIAIPGGAVLSQGQAYTSVNFHIWVGGQFEISTNASWDSSTILDARTDPNHGWAIWHDATGTYKATGGYDTPADAWTQIYLR